MRTSEMARHEGRDTTARLWFLFLALMAMMWWVSACGPTYPNCDTDDHCEGHENAYCLQGTCSQCRQNTHCEEGFQCVAGACEKILNWCKGDGECTGKQRCRNNRCGPECISDADCSDGMVCKEDGTCQVQCVVTTDCPADHNCQSGRCIRQATISDPCSALGAVYFDYNESALTSTARETLRKHSECIKNRSSAVQIEGHCDERGTPEYNIALGERRARSARDYLVSLGVARNRLSMISYGEERPIKYGTGESVWGLNRRCEFVWK